MTSDLLPALLNWYAENARDLPWRRTRDPYAIWLSEVMLQQTRVEVVIDYWTRFKERFPTVADLAGAEEDEVLAMWSGLGYYRRARGLLAASRLIVDKHGGRLPADGAALLALPGFGPYTAGAVGSIAFDLPLAIIDGNVARVFTRLFCIEGVPAAGPAKRAVWAKAEELLPADQSGTWNQALMELGARVCKPTNPACESCPVAHLCQAKAQSRTAELPHKPIKTPPVEVTAEALAILSPGGLLLARRPPEGRNPGLFEIPTRETASDHNLWPATWGHPDFAADFARGHQIALFRHSITKYRIVTEARRIQCNPRAAHRIAAASHYDLVPIEQARQLALSGLTKKILKQI